MGVGKNTLDSIGKLCGALYLDYPRDKYDPKRDLSHMSRIKPIDIKEEQNGVFIYGKYYDLFERAFNNMR
ncbi:MAG: hypothetical protein HWN66_20705 [Candidatus Helarchaeota archaeon]|nr:hypothetical protein [Candidatus Helarchaeota archaeon]